MLARRDGRAFDCVVVDLNTQRDFCRPDYAYPVVNASTLVPALRRVVAWAKRNYAPVISSVESRRMWEVPADGRRLIGCFDGTPGQRKLDFTLFPARACVDMDNTLAVPVDFFRDHQQVVFRKRTDDLLANPKADRFLTQLLVDEFILFGNGIETSVKALALGLLTRGRVVTVVVDACGYWDAGAADLALRQIAAKGAGLITVDELMIRKLDRRVRYPHHRNGRNGHANGRNNGAGGNGSTASDALHFAPVRKMREAK
jgi:nicotinamidase-related amidase